MPEPRTSKAREFEAAEQRRKGAEIIPDLTSSELSKIQLIYLQARLDRRTAAEHAAIDAQRAAAEKERLNAELRQAAKKKHLRNEHPDSWQASTS